MSFYLLKKKYLFKDFLCKTHRIFFFFLGENHEKKRLKSHRFLKNIYIFLSFEKYPRKGNNESKFLNWEESLKREKINSMGFTP